MYSHERSLVQHYQGRPFVLLGVNTDRDVETLKRVQEEQHISWRSWYDGPPGGPLIEEWGVTGFPTLFLIDAKGMVRNSYEGPPQAEELDGDIEKLLQEAESQQVQRPA